MYQGILFEEGIEYLGRVWTVKSGDIDDHQLSDRRTLVAHCAESAVRLHR